MYVSYNEKLGTVPGFFSYKTGDAFRSLMRIKIENENEINENDIIYKRRKGMIYSSNINEVHIFNHEIVNPNTNT